MAAVGRLLGDEARAAILTALADGSERPARELAALARVSPPTASAHLAKLVEHGLLAARRHGRHRYFRLAGPEVADALEALAAIAPPRPVRTLREGAASVALRQARMCYDHLAGSLGVALADVLVERDVLREQDGAYTLGPRGAETLAMLGVDVEAAARRRRVFARPCLDWSQRRSHVGGALGAALADGFFERGWLERLPSGRAVRVTPAGRRGLADLGLVLDS